MPGSIIPTLLRHRSRLLRLSNVIGCGVGRKEVRGESTDRLAVVVFVERKLPVEALSLEDRVPPALEGVPTDVVELGELRLFSERTTRVRPAPPGVSIGHFRVTAGTFGAVAYDDETGTPLILSNNHVLANISNGQDGRARLGDPVYQPGTYDAGGSDDVIGYLLRFAPIQTLPGGLPPQTQTGSLPPMNRIDAAIAQPLSPDLITPEILGLGTIRGVASPKVGERVWKSGRTTGVTEGRVRAVAATLTVAMGEVGLAMFEDQIVTSPMAEPGDSGSAGLTEDRHIFGLLFAGSAQSTVYNDIRNIAQLLRVRFLP